MSWDVLRRENYVHGQDGVELSTFLLARPSLPHLYHGPTAHTKNGGPGQNQAQNSAGTVPSALSTSSLRQRQERKRRESARARGPARSHDTRERHSHGHVSQIRIPPQKC